VTSIATIVLQTLVLQDTKTAIFSVREREAEKEVGVTEIKKRNEHIVKY
jgi:hypothetical protein